MSEQIQAISGTPISFPFHPLERSSYAVEKSDSGGHKRRYLTGISSGVRLDLQGERMTEKCIKSFMSQANSGDILLYPDSHGIKASEDIGILEKGAVKDGDWYTEFRLYDESDGIGANKAEQINTIWKQINGVKPYKKSRPRGFSIEGFIPDGSILSAEPDNYGNLKKRVIDDVKLDGVLLVPRQAYPEGRANPVYKTMTIEHAVYKALGEITPQFADKIKKDFQVSINGILTAEKQENEYFRSRWDIGEAVDKAIERIMKSPKYDKRNQLNVVFDEYKTIMTDLILKSESLFQSEGGPVIDNINPYGKAVDMSKTDIFKCLLSEMEKLSKIMEAR